MSQKQVGKWVQKESGQSFCLLHLGSEPLRKLWAAASQCSHLQILSLRHSGQ